MSSAHMHFGTFVASLVMGTCALVFMAGCGQHPVDLASESSRLSLDAGSHVDVDAATVSAEGTYVASLNCDGAMLAANAHEGCDQPMVTNTYGGTVDAIVSVAANVATVRLTATGAASAFIENLTCDAPYQAVQFGTCGTGLYELTRTIPLATSADGKVSGAIGSRAWGLGVTIRDGRASVGAWVSKARGTCSLAENRFTFSESCASP